MKQTKNTPPHTTGNPLLVERERERERTTRVDAHGNSEDMRGSSRDHTREQRFFVRAA